VRLLAGLLYFVAALLTCGVAAWIYLRAGRRSRQERLTLRLRALGIDETAGSAFVSRERELTNPILRAACHALWRSGVDAEPTTVARALLLGAILVPIALIVLGPIAGPMVLAVAAILVYGWIGQQAARRRGLIVSQLPDLLESVIRVLSAGNTVEEAFAASAREAPEPARSLFMSIGRQVRLGAPIETVLAEAAEIHRLRDLKVMALASGINRKFGGSLRNVLKSLIGVVRARDTASRELRALTRETVWSARWLAGIVIFLTIYIYGQNPDYYAEVWAQTTGRWMLMATGVWEVLGMFVMWRMLRTVERTTA